jgi:DNA-binding response OmpR family regulator
MCVSRRVETGSNSANVLVVDDDADIRELVCRLLERAGLNPAKASDGEEGLRKFFKLHPDVVVLDISMPGMSGLKTLERIRDLSDVPVLLLTARDTEPDKVHGLRSGADDYMTKPFGRQELVARVEALLRRPSSAQAERPSEVFSDALVTIDFVQARATVNGREITLTPLEFKLLAAFVRHPHQVLNHHQLVELVWGASSASRDQVKLYIGYLRRKLRDGAGVEPIETVRGFGYRYRPEPNV